MRVEGLRYQSGLRYRSGFRVEGLRYRSGLRIEGSRYTSTAVRGFPTDARQMTTLPESRARGASSVSKVREASKGCAT